MDWINSYFPDHASPFTDLTTDMAEERSHLGGLSWRRLGVIARTNAMLLTHALAEVTTLPSEAHYVEVILFRPAPSFYIITLDVQLTKNYRDGLLDVLREKQKVEHIFEVEFTRWKPRISSSGNKSAEVITQEALSAEIARLVRSLEVALGLEFGADKGSSNVPRVPTLSWTSVYHISGAVADEAALQEWIKLPHRWLRSFDIDFPYAGCYCEGLFWTWPSRASSASDATSTLVVFPEIASNATSKLFPNTDSALASYAEDKLNAAAIPVSLLAEYYNFEQTIAYLYDTVGRRREKVAIAGLARQHMRARDVSLLLEEIVADIDERMPQLKANFDSEFSGFRVVIPNGWKPVELSIYDELDRYGKQLLRRAIFLRQTNLDYLHSLSIETNDRLMRKTLMTSVAAVLASIAAVSAVFITNWSSTRRFYNDTLISVQRLFHQTGPVEERSVKLKRHSQTPHL